jgi:hypothetical protein
MKQIKIAIQLVCAAALAALLPACSTTTTSTTAATPQMVTQLTQAGFTAYPAKTAEQKAHIQSLPADKITKVNRHGKNMWVYPDAANNQVYVGNSAQYKAFRDARKAQTGLDADEDLVRSFNTQGTSGIQVNIYDGFVPMNALDH